MVVVFACILLPGHFGLPEAGWLVVGQVWLFFIFRVAREGVVISMHANILFSGDDGKSLWERGWGSKDGGTYEVSETAKDKTRTFILCL